MSKEYKNPLPTVDIIIELATEVAGEIYGDTDGGGIVLIERKNPPHGWALPGGFVDYGESLEAAAVREAKEETSLDVKLKCQLHAYSAPERDSRFHTITTVFVATATGTPIACDDAANVAIFTKQNLPETIAFDHADILKDYFRWKREGWWVFG